MNADKQTMDRRWGVRLNLEAPALMRAVQGLETEVSIRDASVSGAFLTTRLKPALLSPVAIRPEGDAGDWIEAFVSRVDGEGIALEWQEPGSQPTLDLLEAAKRSPHSARRDDWLDQSVRQEALARARSEVNSGEFDVQG